MIKFIKSSECNSKNSVMCDCEGWVNSIDQIFYAQQLAALHGTKYTGYRFNFCPWCGKNIYQ